MSIQSLEFLSLASSEMVRSAVRQQASYQPPETDDAFSQLLSRLSQTENVGNSTDTRGTRPCLGSE